ncbi:MAG: hypothetical protein ACI4GA_04550 [Acutalibacteraceae bacterium]
MKKKIAVTILAILLVCFLIVETYPNNYILIVNEKNASSSVQDATPANAVVTTTAKAAAQTDNSGSAADSSESKKSDKKSDSKKSDKNSGSEIPQTKEEIVQKYAEVVKKFKHEKPGYTKKEYQALPEDKRQFSSNLVNKLLGFGEKYMTKEDSENAVVTREKGYADIINEIPIYGMEEGCLLTDYSTVKNATCTKNSDGTYKLSFSLEDEVNPEPLAPGSKEPKSYHAAVLMPGNREDIMTEVHKVEKLSGAKCNNFDLTYRDCTFECVYNPENDQVVSITHHHNIDITADIHFIKDITGSARLTNDMLVYDIVW